MERKKDLNIWLLILSLITIITILLPFAKTLTISEDLSLWIKIVFYGTISLFILSLAIIAITALICLIKDRYQAIKLIEFCVLFGFLMVFINILVFACTNQKITVGYAIMALETFIMSAFSQSVRLFAALPGFGKDFASLFKKDGKKKEKENNKTEESPAEAEVQEELTEAVKEQEESEEKIEKKKK